MPVVFQYRLFSTPTALLKTLVLSSAVVATVVLSGCASKPQVNNSARYATAPNFYTVRSGDTLSRYRCTLWFELSQHCRNE